MDIVQLRTPTEGRDYYDRKASGKGPVEAMRCASSANTTTSSCVGCGGMTNSVVSPHPARLASQGGSAGSAAQRNPVLPVELSAVFAVRAATR